MDVKINSSFDALVTETSFYLNFMSRRADIEERFAEELLKLALKTEEREKDIHRGTAQSTLKTTWTQLKADSLRIAEAHRNTALQLRKAVCEPLQAFRDTQDRSKRRVADQLRACLDEHNTYRGAVSRFKRTYLGACDNVKTIQQTMEASQPPANPSRDKDGPGSDQGEEDAYSLPVTPRASFDVISGITEGSLRDTQPPAATASAASRAHDALRTSRQQFTTLFNRLGNAGKERERDRDASFDGSPSAATSPSSQPGVLEQPSLSRSQSRGGSPPLTHPHPAQPAPAGAVLKEPPALSAQERAAQTVRLIKAKNEAERADSEYRRGVIWFETLRLQKERVHRSSATSVLEFVAELDNVMKEALQSYCEAIKYGTASVEAYADRTYTSAHLISPEQDAASYAGKLPMDQPLDAPTLYENAFFGPCARLLFGIPLTDHASSFSPPRLVPRIVLQCIQQVQQRLEEAPVEGLYRISPSMRKVQRLAMKVEADGDAFEFKPDVDVHLVTALLKLYLRQLPVSLMHMPSNDRLALSSALMSQNFSDSNEERLNALASLGKRLKRLPVTHQATLKVVIEHLDHVRLFEESTKMDLTNIALVWSPCVFGDPDEVQLELSGGHNDNLLEALVIHHSTLFEGLPHDFTTSRSRSSSAVQPPPWQAPAAPRDDDEEFPMRKPEGSSSNRMSHAASVSRGLFTGMKRRASSARNPKNAAVAAATSPNPAGGTDQRPTSPLSLTRQHSNLSQQSLSLATSQPHQQQQQVQFGPTVTTPNPLVTPAVTTTPMGAFGSLAPGFSDDGLSSAQQQPTAAGGSSGGGGGGGQPRTPEAELESDLKDLYVAYQGGGGGSTDSLPPHNRSAGSLIQAGHLPPGASPK